MLSHSLRLCSPIFSLFLYLFMAMPTSSGPSSSAPRMKRDLRIDFWRGVAMFIIYIAHMPGNFWAWYIPARFGPSDAAEIFVFCSGYASAIAFGGSFQHTGFLAGTGRVAYRIWQIYWAQIGLFLVMLALCYLGSTVIEDRDYIAQLNLSPFVREPARGVFHLLGLNYVPNLFDMLPMYMIVLALIPLVVLAHHLGGRVAAFGLIIILYCAAQIGLELPAEWWSDRPWFFNPFGWALLFFTGFFVASGWIQIPGKNVFLMVTALFFVIFLIPLSYWPIWRESELLTTLHNLMKFGFGIEKTNFGLIRYFHFLALAYLAHIALQNRLWLLQMRWSWPIIQVGQNALPVFLTSLPLAYIAGMVLHVTAQDSIITLMLNLGGFILLTAIAIGTAWFKREPWRPLSVSKSQARRAN